MAHEDPRLNRDFGESTDVMQAELLQSLAARTRDDTATSEGQESEAASSDTGCAYYDELSLDVGREEPANDRAETTNHREETALLPQRSPRQRATFRLELTLLIAAGLAIGFHAHPRVRGIGAAMALRAPAVADPAPLTDQRTALDAGTAAIAANNSEAVAQRPNAPSTSRHPSKGKKPLRHHHHRKGRVPQK